VANRVTAIAIASRLQPILRKTVDKESDLNVCDAAARIGIHHGSVHAREVRRTHEFDRYCGLRSASSLKRYASSDIAVYPNTDPDRPALSASSRYFKRKPARRIGRAAHHLLVDVPFDKSSRQWLSARCILHYEPGNRHGDDGRSCCDQYNRSENYNARDG
jgi:hypothetical protein